MRNFTQAVSLLQICLMIGGQAVWGATRTVNFAGMAVSHYSAEPGAGTGTVHLYCDIIVVNVGTVSQSVNVNVSFLNSAPSGGSLAQGAGVPGGNTIVSMRSDSTGSYTSPAALPVTLNARGGINTVRVTSYNTFAYNAGNTNYRMMCVGSITVSDIGATPGSVIATGSLEYLANHDQDKQRMNGEQCPSSSSLSFLGIPDNPQGWVGNNPDTTANLGNQFSPGDYSLDDGPLAPPPAYQENNHGIYQMWGNPCNLTAPIGPTPGSTGCGCSSTLGQGCQLWDPTTVVPPWPRAASPPAPSSTLPGSPSAYWQVSTSNNSSNSQPGVPHSFCYYIDVSQGGYYPPDQPFTNPSSTDGWGNGDPAGLGLPFANTPSYITGFPHSIGSQPIMIKGGMPF
jgi:hypothetical protein